MIPWTFGPPPRGVDTEQFVFRVHPNGVMESHFISAKKIVRDVARGNVIRPLPQDSPQFPNRS